MRVTHIRADCNGEARMRSAATIAMVDVVHNAAADISALAGAELTQAVGCLPADVDVVVFEIDPDATIPTCMSEALVVDFAARTVADQAFRTAVLAAIRPACSPELPLPLDGVARFAAGALALRPWYIATGMPHQCRPVDFYPMWGDTAAVEYRWPTLFSAFCRPLPGA
jgi:hypothetical protein